MNTLKLIRNVAMFTSASLLASHAFASGFMIPEQGGKAMGMGNAFSAVATDASANWFNPAGLSFQDNNATVSSVVVYPINDFETAGTTYSAKKTTHIVPQAYLRYGGEDSDLSFGFGINAPFGLSVDWTDSNAPFSKLAAGGDSVTFSEIQAIHVNPNVAYKVNDNFSVAVGLSYYNAFKVHLNSRAVNIGGSGDGFGGNFAAMYKTDAWSVGASYRSKVKVDITGTAVGQEAGAVLGLQGIAGNASTSVTFPDIQTLAMSYKPNSDLTLSLQLDRVNWATFDQIKVDFAPSALNTLTTSTKTIPEGWKATTAIRLGAELALSQSSKLRAGYVNDPTPTNPTDFSPRLPGNDRQLVTLGYGSELSDDLTLDLAYAYVWLADRTATSPTNVNYYGTYKSVVHILAAGVTYNF